MNYRTDETWHRLLNWTAGQADSERLSALVLMSDGYSGLDPSHPLGGQDGGKDAIGVKDGLRYVIAVYFPRGQKAFSEIEKKFLADLKGATKNSADGFAFVTNQELRLAERKELVDKAKPIKVELFHLERVALVLDQPNMAPVRMQFLGIDFTEEALRKEIESTKSEILVKLEGLQTGGDTFCYAMFYDFDLKQAIARNFVFIRSGKYPLYDVRYRLHDFDARKDLVREDIGELNSPADFKMVKWPLRDEHYYRFFFHARNGNWHQDLLLKKSAAHRCWLAATRVIRDGQVVYQHVDQGFGDDPIPWRP